MSNPFRNPAPWKVIKVGNLELPGVIRSVNGCERPEEWVVQRPTIQSGAVTIWRGTKIAETIEIVLDLTNADQYDLYEVARTVLRPKVGTRPPTHNITHPKINFSGITRVSCRDVQSPVWEGGHWSGKILLIQYSPPRIANTGPAAPPKPNGVDPNADRKAQVKAATAAFNKAMNAP